MSLTLFETDCSLLNYSGDTELNLLSLFSKILINESTIDKQQSLNGSMSDIGMLEGRIVIGRGSPNFPVDVKIVARPHGKDIISRRHACVVGKFQLLYRSKAKIQGSSSGIGGGGGRGSSPPSSCSLQNAYSLASEFYLEPISYTIEDVGAVNGIFVNGYRVKTAELYNNDIIQLGGAANCKFFDKISNSDLNIKFQFKHDGHFHKVTRTNKPKQTKRDSLAFTTSSGSVNGSVSVSGSKRSARDVDENTAVTINTLKSSDETLTTARSMIGIVNNEDNNAMSANSAKKAKRGTPGSSSGIDVLSPNDIENKLMARVTEKDEIIEKKIILIEKNNIIINELKVQLAEEERMKDSFLSEIETHISTISTLKKQLLEQQNNISTTVVLREQFESAQEGLARSEAALVDRARDVAALERSLAEYKTLYAESMGKVKALTKRASQAEMQVQVVAGGGGATNAVDSAHSGRGVDVRAGLLDCLKCGICRDIMVDASILRNCSHGFCRSCLESHLRSSISSERCPVCNYRVSDGDGETRVGVGKEEGESVFTDLYSRSAQLDGLCALAVECASSEQQTAYALRIVNCSASLSGYGVSVDLPCNWKQQLREFNQPSVGALPALSEQDFRAANGYLVLNEEERAAIYSDGLVNSATTAETATAAETAAVAATAVVTATVTAATAVADKAAGPRCYYCGGDDHDHEDCEHFEKIEESDFDSASDVEEEEEEEEESEQSRDY